MTSWMETGARLFVTRFFRNLISTGTIMCVEDGGAVFKFEGYSNKCSLKAVLKIHSPQFYSKIMTRADLGFADSYVDGDLSFVDQEQGLLTFLLIIIANKDLDSPGSMKRGWWTPMLFTAAISSAKCFLRHVLRQNTLTQARRNISRHYDLTSKFFALFMDETLTYSCAVFKDEDEELKDAQMRKMSCLINKARIVKGHEVLELGSGWGNFAIQVVKRTGCKYTGITLSEEQLKYSENKVKEAGLEDSITFLLCDYRLMPGTRNEMMEHVGHEYLEEFFGCCESLLAEDGLVVLQFTSLPDQLYEEFMLSAGFLREYIFPGGNVPSLGRITSSMATSSKLCIEHVENIGMHYYKTLQCWRKNLMDNPSKILDLGFDRTFIRTWEYYFIYCAAGFKSRIFRNYQIVVSRPGNMGAFTDPYKGFPSAYVDCHK